MAVSSLANPAWYLEFARHQRVLLRPTAAGAPRALPAATSRDRGGWSRRPRYCLAARCSSPSARPTAAQCAASGFSTGAPSRRATRPGGLAVEETPQRAGAIGLRRRRHHARARKMRHEIEIKRQLFRRQALVERQHVAPLGGSEKVIAVFDAGGDGLEVVHRAQRIARQPGCKFIGGDGGIDRHQPTRPPHGGRRFAAATGQLRTRTAPTAGP